MENSKIDPRQIILDAALEVVAENKISGTRMRLIAEQAGMSQGNLHYYFTTKDDLLVALLKTISQRFVDERKTMLAQTNLSLEDRLFSFFDQEKQTIRRRKEMYVLFDFWVQSTTNPLFRELMQNDYRIWRHDIETALTGAGGGESIHTPGRAAIPALMASLMDGAALQYMIDEDAFDLDVYFVQAQKMIHHLLELA
jgi:AcrR family transcriptional regulator